MKGTVLFLILVMGFISSVFADIGAPKYCLGANAQNSRQIELEYVASWSALGYKQIFDVEGDSSYQYRVTMQAGALAKKFILDMEHARYTNDIYTYGGEIRFNFHDKGYNSIPSPIRGASKKEWTITISGSPSSSGSVEGVLTLIFEDFSRLNGGDTTFYKENVYNIVCE